MGFLYKTLLLISVIAVAFAAPHGIPGPSSDASMTKFYTDIKTRATAGEIATCKGYPTGQFIPWAEIARDWVTGGGRHQDCAAALIVASGETSCTKGGCASVKSGIWQVTSPDMPAPSGCPDGDTNACCTVDFVRNHIATNDMSKTKTTSWQVGCIGEFNDGNGWPGDPRNDKKSMDPSKPMAREKVVPDVVPGDHAGGGLAGTQSNWIGPFCHQGGFSCDKNDPYCHSHPQTGQTGDNWGGGSLWRGSGRGDQIYPWPYYYYARFLESQGDSKGMTGDMHCHTMPVNHAVGTCGGIPSQNIPDCDQPVTGKAPSAQNQKCLDSITDRAIQIAKEICASAYRTFSEVSE